ncbi:LOW QUALITY PROTEIN: SPFH domain / Band 7 family protein,putative [Schistosoma mansoni]|uniref:SPFH domain / Band 7 family protein,putative n=1 Tax=Schistosoma mansoni TaxID=6183 RepID=UPI00022C862E|nr:LOW QUALITY PROTEIN: SPFH domain / Band 7 family protein,putative [Schistosoma mansoni]|eukprot:XP_018645098.1 LOW QUALITY PROTEIN: SPFH domain / Band 7 family protein,putative [Schistosoma mansoni]
MDKNVSYYFCCYALSFVCFYFFIFFYLRYIKWIEQNYPSLGKSADLQNVLYRSIRDSSDLLGIKNNDTYVGNWIKLTEYCNQPIELFELLFRQGIGTMCSEFYITWCQLLEKGKNYRKIASIYAHGLRAGAKPLLWLEDRADKSIRPWNYLSIRNYSNKCNYQIKQDKLTQENSVLIRDLPPITSDFIRPVGIPSSWQKENQMEPSSWNKLTTTTTVPASSRPISLPNWEIFTEDQVEQTQTDSSNLLNNTQQSTVCTKRKGLKMKSLKESDPCQPTNEISFIEVSSFNHLLHHHDHGVVVDHSSSHQSDVLLTKLNLPSFPSDKISEIDCFAFDISLIYGGIEELCWEMHRGLKWDINYTNSLNNSSAKDDHRRMLNDFWDKEELELIEEINTILHDNNNDDGTVNNLQMNDPLLMNKNVESSSLCTY